MFFKLHLRVQVEIERKSSVTTTNRKLRQGKKKRDIMKEYPAEISGCIDFLCLFQRRYKSSLSQFDIPEEGREAYCHAQEEEHV